MVTQGWPLWVKRIPALTQDYTLGSNREALLARLLASCPLVALFGFTASPLHPFAEAKAIAQVDATFNTCRFCRPGALRASVLIVLGSVSVVIRPIVHRKSWLVWIASIP